MMPFVRAKTALVGTAVNTDNALPINTFSKTSFSRTPLLRTLDNTQGRSQDSFRGTHNLPNSVGNN